MTPELTLHRPNDERNSLAEFFRDRITAQMCRLRYTGDATYEQLINFLHIAVAGAITPTIPGGGTSSRDWTFTPSETASNAQESITVEYGDDTQEWECGFAMAERLELIIALNEVLQVNCDMFAQFPAKSSFTGALSETSVVEVVNNNMQVFIDGTWAHLGTTEKATLVTGGAVRL